MDYAGASGEKLFKRNHQEGIEMDLGNLDCAVGGVFVRNSGNNSSLTFPSRPDIVASCLLRLRAGFASPAWRRLRAGGGKPSTLSSTTRTDIMKQKTLVPFRILTLWVGILCCVTITTSAQTLVSGNISGTWTPAGNPYVAVDNCTVPSGQTLSISPGVNLIIGSNIYFTVNGTMLAAGTAASRITVKGATPAASYGAIHVNYSGNPSRFEYCDFANAERALWFDITNHTGVEQATFKPLVANCTFSNIWRTAIRGSAVGMVHSAQYAGDVIFAENNHLDAVVVNCVFGSCNNGCAFGTAGTYYYQPFLDLYSYGYASPRIADNVFVNTTNIAVYTVPDSLSGSSTPSVMNNVIVSAGYGIYTSDPFDLTIKNNIFVSNTNGILRTGTLSGTVGFNCFYQNQTNFVGYPGVFGQVVMVNRNGTACDVAFDLFQDPLFSGPGDYHLAANSPCIDAGTADWGLTDMCFPPSRGNSYTDLGAYGGPDACNWLNPVPKVVTEPWMSITNGVVWLSWGGVPRSAYQVYWATNLVSSGTNTWVTGPSFYLVADGKLCTGWVNTTNLPQRFFRIESLGGPTAY
jgi:hypothetical protein